MVYRNFQELIEEVQKSATIKRVVVVAAHDEHTLEAVFRARKDNICQPILIGDKEKIKAIIGRLNEVVADENIMDSKSDEESARLAVELVNQNKADFIMKGLIQTADLLMAVVNKDTGCRTGNVMSHMAIHEMETYHKLLAVTDGGMTMYPDLDTKADIIRNAVGVFNNMGYENPKVGVLAAVERENPKMPESVDGARLKEMNQKGQIENCIIEGPISYDLAMSKESAKIKGFESELAGDPDILIVPNITAGNILGKSLTYSAGAKMAGFIVGAKVPIVLTSRGSSSEEKYLSIVLSASVVK